MFFLAIDNSREIKEGWTVRGGFIHPFGGEHTHVALESVSFRIPVLNAKQGGNGAGLMYVDRRIRWHDFCSVDRNHVDTARWHDAVKLQPLVGTQRAQETFFASQFHVSSKFCYKGWRLPEILDRYCDSQQRFSAFSRDKVKIAFPRLYARYLPNIRPTCERELCLGIGLSNRELSFRQFLRVSELLFRNSLRFLELSLRIRERLLSQIVGSFCLANINTQTNQSQYFYNELPCLKVAKSIQPWRLIGTVTGICMFAWGRWTLSYTRKRISERIAVLGIICTVGGVILTLWSCLTLP
jgi:hypothetical protein